MKKAPTYLDRYPAKMVGRLAHDLVATHAEQCKYLLDPFCGSGAILSAARIFNVRATGIDINPFAVLMAKVKTQGFDGDESSHLIKNFIERAKRTTKKFNIGWEPANFWFTPGTLRKYERLRYVGREMGLSETREGRAVLLAFAQSVRRCSRADQRSPKPFISKKARENRYGLHFDPFIEIPFLHSGLRRLYGTSHRSNSNVVCANVTDSKVLSTKVGQYSHVITSPPYINAQDYFRNFKLELFFLRGLLNCDPVEIQSKFIGTERGNLLEGLPTSELDLQNTILPQLMRMDRDYPRQAAIVRKYFHAMSRAFDLIHRSLRPEGVCVLVCGDNLVSGAKIPTWKVNNQLLVSKGFSIKSTYPDRIQRRSVPPKRQGHKSLIKTEFITTLIRTR